MRRVWLMLAVLLLGCGASAESDGARSEPAIAPSATEAAAEPSAAEPAASTGASDDLPLRSIRAAAVPDPCALLTAEDAAELLGTPVGPPLQPDAGGYPCVYRSESGDGQIALDMSLARGAEVEDTQLAMSLEYCEGETVVELDDIGYHAALFRMTKQDCGSDTFWVSTGVYFEATELPPNSDWIPEGYIHFSFSLRPEPDDDALVEKLGTAAKRALGRLPR